jgi:hypothetical protein
MVEQKVLFKTAINCLGDVSRSYQTEIVEKVIHVFKRLLNYIRDNIDRELKIYILSCFGDLTLGLKRYSECFLSDILIISDNCFEAVYKFSSIKYFM